jgi:hypothetical protein
VQICPSAPFSKAASITSSTMNRPKISIDEQGYLSQENEFPVVIIFDSQHSNRRATTESSWRKPILGDHVGTRSSGALSAPEISETEESQSKPAVPKSFKFVNVSSHTRMKRNEVSKSRSVNQNSRQGLRKHEQDTHERRVAGILVRTTHAPPRCLSTYPIDIKPYMFRLLDLCTTPLHSAVETPSSLA